MTREKNKSRERNVDMVGEIEKLTYADEEDIFERRGVGSGFEQVVLESCKEGIEV